MKNELDGTSPLDASVPPARSSLSRGSRAAIYQAIALLAFVIGAVAWVVHGNSSPLDAKGLGILISSLRSPASELSLLAQQRQKRFLPSGYWRTHLDEQRDLIDQTLQSVASSRPRPELADAHRQAVQLANELRGTVWRTNDATLHESSRKLDDLATQLRKLEDSLPE